MKRTRLAQLMIFTVMCAALHGDATTGPGPLLLDRSLSPAGGGGTCTLRSATAHTSAGTVPSLPSAGFRDGTRCPWMVTVRPRYLRRS